PRGDVPEPADHVVADAGELGSVRRDGELAHGPTVGVVDGADDAVRFDVVPDEAIVVAAGDGDAVGEADGVDVAAMLREPARRRVGGARVDLGDEAVGAGYEDLRRARNAGDAERNAGPGDLAGLAEVSRVGGGRHGNDLLRRMGLLTRPPAPTSDQFECF